MKLQVAETTDWFELLLPPIYKHFLLALWEMDPVAFKTAAQAS